MPKHNIAPTQPITIRELITEVYGRTYTRQEYRRAYKLLQKLNEKCTKKFLFQLGNNFNSPWIFSLYGLKEAGLECFGDSSLFEENEDLKARIEELEEELAYFHGQE